MARDFNGTSDYAINNAAVVTAFPLTMVCWFNSDTITAGQAAMSLGLAGGTQRLQLTVNGASIGDPIHATSITSGGAATQAASASGYSANTWHHAAAIYGSTTSRYAALDGVLGLEDTTSSDPGIASLNRTLLGARIASGSVGGYTNGRIAEAAIYNVALTADEIAMLAKGYSPLMVRPDALVAYWPVVGRNSPETDIVGGYDLTLTGTSASEHPRIIRPSAKILTFPSASGGSNYTLTGAVTHTLTPAASFTINRQHSIAGAVSFTLTPSATLDIDRTHSLAGAVTLSLTPSASMAYTAAGSASINGAVTYTLTPAATFAINRAYTLAGAVTHTLSVAASMQYTAQQAIEFVGAVTYTLTPAAVMVGPGMEAVTPSTAGWYFPKVKRNDWRERTAKERREYLGRLLEAAESAPEEVREEVEEILESVTGQEDETVNVARIEVARINRLIARIERALEDEDEAAFMLMAS